ncbi:prephenate dehydrogenase [Oceanobacillus piezotolerans]|uniref:Prephenate dehydrogenase n=1 Tax=Oceanobacillus piezotolerans TaxID=2448030 RepID=A0A498DDB9_9BACI|nr:prephenate dehydrogenase [Oceanobacillus piezotolerans]RLL48212.1 prephenate dehydrogenase [Oceanobacillus piezotolerans]
MKKNIVVAGLGLIGGSLAKSMMLAEENHVIGYDVNQDSLDFALFNGIIHQAANEFLNAIQDADFIIFATPISETISLINELNQTSLKKDVIVSDVASVKSSVINTAKELTNERITFIGGHPMAGSHKKGISAAKAHLFENAMYVLTPAYRSTPEKLSALKEILQNTKSNFVVLNAEEHDEMTAVISHFPHLIASSLVHQASKWQNKHAFLPNLAAGGFRDITRIASSNPELWQDIFYHNRQKVSQLLKDWIEEMANIKELIDTNEKEKMVHFLKEAKNYRDGLPDKSIGAIPSFYDIYVDIRDQPGALASVTLLLANKNISIKNIEILEIREGITGALRLSFYSKKTQLKSMDILQQHGFEAMIQA